MALIHNHIGHNHMWTAIYVRRNIRLIHFSPEQENADIYKQENKLHIELLQVHCNEMNKLA